MTVSYAAAACASCAAAAGASCAACLMLSFISHVPLPPHVLLVPPPHVLHVSCNLLKFMYRRGMCRRQWVSCLDHLRRVFAHNHVVMFFARGASEFIVVVHVPCDCAASVGL